MGATDSLHAGKSRPLPAAEDATLLGLDFSFGKRPRIPQRRNRLQLFRPNPSSVGTYGSAIAAGFPGTRSRLRNRNHHTAMARSTPMTDSATKNHSGPPMDRVWPNDRRTGYRHLAVLAEFLTGDTENQSGMSGVAGQPPATTVQGIAGPPDSEEASPCPLTNQAGRPAAW